MKRVIVDYAKLTNDILSLLVDKFPDGYEDTDIIRFKNAQNELVEAVEVKTADTIYLVKVSKKLVTRMDNFEEENDELTSEVDMIQPVKGMDLEEDEDEDDDLPKKKRSNNDEDEDEDFNADDVADEDDEDEDDY